MEREQNFFGKKLDPNSLIAKDNISFKQSSLCFGDVSDSDKDVDVGDQTIEKYLDNSKLMTEIRKEEEKRSPK